MIKYCDPCHNRMVVLTGEYQLPPCPHNDIIDFIYKEFCVWTGKVEEHIFNYYMSDYNSGWLEIDNIKYIPYARETRVEFLNRITVPLHNAMVNNALENI